MLGFHAWGCKVFGGSVAIYALTTHLATIAFVDGAGMPQLHPSQAQVVISAVPTHLSLGVAAFCF